MKNQWVREQLDIFIETAREANLKVTPQRLVILEALLRSGNHPDVESVFQKVREKLPTISLDTVYRTLWTLKELGMVDTLGLSPERIRFDSNTKPHHHFVCTKCGSITDFYMDEFDSMFLPSSLRDLGDIECSHMELRGTCRVCRQKAKAREEKKHLPKT